MNVPDDLSALDSVGLNLDDPAVRDMVRFGHSPRDEWTEASELIGVACRRCNAVWPCPPTRALRARLDADDR